MSSVHTDEQRSRAALARQQRGRTLRPLEDVSAEVDAAAAVAIKGLENAALTAERHGIELRTAKLATRGDRTAGWFVSLKTRTELVASWYSGSGVLIVGGRRMLAKTLATAVRVVVRRFGPEMQVRAA